MVCRVWWGPLWYGGYGGVSYGMQGKRGNLWRGILWYAGYGGVPYGMQGKMGNLWYAGYGGVSYGMQGMVGYYGIRTRHRIYDKI